MKAYIINSIALALYFLFAGFSIGGVLLTWRLCGWSRLIGVLFGFLGLSAAALLTFMSSKYWFGDEDFFAAFIDINIVQLAIQTVVTLGALGIAVVVCWGLARWTRQRLERHQSLRWVAVPLFVLMLLAGSGIAGLITLSQKDKPVPVVAAERQLHIAAGFQATIYAETQIHAPTSMAVGPDQRLYISDFKGRIWAITDQNGIASTPQLFADKLDRPVGIAWRGDQLYVAVHGKILVL